MNVRTLTATRYVAPLREGGSLPALAEASDGELYVVKFRGAGQGRKALVAEFIAGEIARALGLDVPELAFIELDATFGENEQDSEIQDLLRASAGVNLALKFLAGAFMFDPIAESVNARLASQIVWFDALVMNVDRTVKNPNLLCWCDDLWLIDHGAALFFHYNWSKDFMARARTPFAPLHEHVLLPFATELQDADAELAPRLTHTRVHEIIHAIPDEWLADEPPFEHGNAVREAYIAFLDARLQTPRSFFKVR